MKSACLILSGLPRDFRGSCQSISNRLILPNKINFENIFITVWNEIGFWSPGDSITKASFRKSGKIVREDVESVYPGASIEILDFNEHLPLIELEADKYEERYLEKFQHSNFFARKINILSMFYIMQKAVNRVPQKYSHAIRTRPDIVLEKKIRCSNRYNILFQRNHFGGGVGDNFHSGKFNEIVTVGNVWSNLYKYYLASESILCPHLLVKEALKDSQITFKEKKIKFTTLHTPGGQYKVENTSGEWVELGNFEYKKNTERFKG